jgi:hypothetical protein
MLALAIGTLLVVAALAYVLYPLVFAPAPSSVAHVSRGDRARAATRTRSSRCARSSSTARRASCPTPTTRSQTRYTQRALDAMRAGEVAAAEQASPTRRRRAVLAIARGSELRALRAAARA